ncbi:cupin domain-containing protein [Flavobacterium sp. Sd200]|uniref:cupin domain-containing protein n=1 Tax=Flavobacterium sp. Sd200 TaxID=2692211 RepID=UPI00136CC81F|nr:cupin domain-containing protein [Flavobacterium sp. Sd200]MXN92100.1 cupin domain-containing protein [Flavobacterium sp. Sd200]
MKIESGAFFIESDNEWEVVGEGVKRQITGYNTTLMMVKVAFEKGSIGAVHQHFHSQASFVASGQFEVTVDGVAKILRAGDTFFAVPNVWHGVVCLEAGMLIDAFSPIREDFLK